MKNNFLYLNDALALFTATPNSCNTSSATQCNTKSMRVSSLTKELFPKSGPEVTWGPRSYRETWARFLLFQVTERMDERRKTPCSSNFPSAKPSEISSDTPQKCFQAWLCRRKADQTHSYTMFPNGKHLSTKQTFPRGNKKQPSLFQWLWTLTFEGLHFILKVIHINMSDCLPKSGLTVFKN